MQCNLRRSMNSVRVTRVAPPMLSSSPNSYVIKTGLSRKSQVFSNDLYPHLKYS
jgi:hypothetical protein